MTGKRPLMAMRQASVVAVVCAAGAAACGRAHAPAPAPVLPARVVYERAMHQYRTGHCGDARNDFQILTSQLAPADTLVALSQYYQAECDFADGLYLEASHGFRRVADEHTAFRLAPDALLRAGDAEAALWTDPELDPEYGNDAMTTYRELLARFPDSRAAARATLKIAALTNQFADKEYRNGIFYLRLKAYDSAILYFRGVVADYPQSRFAAPALLKLVQIYRTLDYAQERQDTCDHLRRYYPQANGLAQQCPPADSSSAR
jgi:outer membrane protein assembly factor BamD